MTYGREKKISHRVRIVALIRKNKSIPLLPMLSSCQCSDDGVYDVDDPVAGQQVQLSDGGRAGAGPHLREQ